MFEKEKTYKFSKAGYEKMMLDIKKDKINKISGAISVVTILGMLAAGILSKEIVIIMFTNMGINKVTTWIVG